MEKHICFQCTAVVVVVHKQRANKDTMVSQVMMLRCSLGFFCWFCFLLGVCHVVNIKFKNWKQQRGFRVKTYTNNRIKRRSGGRVLFFKVVRSHLNLTSVLLSLTHVCGLVKVWWSASFHWPTPVSHSLWYWMVHFPSSPSSGGWIFLAHGWFKVWLAGSLQYW